MHRRALAAFLLVLASCTDDGPTALGCDRTPVRMGAIGPKVQGRSADFSVWALLFTPPPVHAGSEVKIVWRITGSGGLLLQAIDPAGGVHPPSWGQEAHGGSNWDRPGLEWGTAVAFDRPGCWRLHVQRASGSGDVWLDIVS